MVAERETHRSYPVLQIIALVFETLLATASLEAKTLADPVLRRDTMGTIRLWVAMLAGERCTAQLISAEPIGDVQSYRLNKTWARPYRWNEIWTVKACKEVYRFRVEYRTIKDGGTKFSVTRTP